MANQPQTNGHFADVALANAMDRRVKTPTVHEALPFTPFSSIHPFDPDILPAPTFVDKSSINAAAMEKAAAHKARELLGQLSNGAERAEHASERCQKTLQDVKRLLQTTAPSHFIFRKPLQRLPDGANVEKPSCPRMSAFAEMFLQSQPLPQDQPSTELGLPVQPVIAPSQHFTNMPGNNTHDKPPRGIAVPETLTTAQQAQFRNVPDHRLEDNVIVPAPKSLVIDERAKGNTAVHDLNSLLADIFDAQDSAQGGQELDLYGNSHFVDVDTADGSVLILSPATQAKLDSSLRKVATSGRLEDLPIDSIKRLQKVCEPNVLRATFASLSLDDDDTESGVDDWQQRLMTADSSLVAVRILLRTMTAGKAVRELRPESLLRSILELLKHVAESALVPIVELRPKAGSKDKTAADLASSSFSIAIRSRKQLTVVMQDFGKALRLFCDFLAEVEVDESAVSGIMYMCRAILFAENATTDKESILGVQNFETLRRLAMNIVASLFQRHVDQRKYVISELLLSLEKLPPSKQTARQFRLPNSKPIQLVSALFMQLVQISAITIRSSRSIEVHQTETALLGGSLQDEMPAEHSIENPDADPMRSIESLRSAIGPATIATKTYAQYIVSTLVERALNISKSSDEPFRKLLDIFVDDFLTVLGLPEWPSAELLLRCLFAKMASILRETKSNVPSRNFALDLLGRLGSGVLELKAQIKRHAHASVDSDVADSGELSKIVESMLEGEDMSTALLIGDGVYRKFMYGLHEQAVGSQTDSQAFHQLLWAQMLLALCDRQEGYEEQARGQEPTKIATVQHLANTCGTIQQLLLDPLWFERHAAQSGHTTTYLALAANLLILNTDFCKSLPSILGRLHSSMRSDHATERAQALRSTSILIEANPSMIDHQSNLLRTVINCTGDASSLVRDSSMHLLTKCMELRPQLGAKMYESISLRCLDTSPNVRRRAMKVLREVFVHNDSSEIRANIVRTIVGRLQDTEDSVSTLALQTLIDILFRPVIGDVDSSKNNIQDNLALESLAELLVQVVEVVEVEDDILASLLKLFRELSSDSKSGSQHTRVCRRLVEILFDAFIGDTSLKQCSDPAVLLRTIAVLVEARPTLLKPSQLELLAPYLQNLTEDDLPVFRMALAVLQHGISQAKGLKKDFLINLQTALIRALTKLGEIEVSGVAVCLAAIDTELQNTEKLVNVQLAALKRLQSSIGIVPDADVRKTQRLLHMAGQFGRVCDFEPFFEKYQPIRGKSKSTSTAGICVDLFCIFANEEQPAAVRQSALAAICAVAQRSPKQFLSRQVVTRFDQIINADDRELIHVCLQGMLAFFSSQEHKMPAGADEEDATGRERLASTYVATDQDGASAGMSQHFLPAIKRLALSSADELALTATRLMVSIVQQGLPHPKECGPTIIALETSSNEIIAGLAAAEHRTLHDKHETIIEKEYMRSMDQALAYQQNTIGDSRGYTALPPVSKLRHFWTVLKGGKAKVRQKFIINLCQKMSFELARLDVHDSTPTHLALVRFLVENLAFFDYDRVDDLKSMIDELGKVFAAVGASLAQTIDTQVNNISIEALGPSSDSAVQYALPALMRPRKESATDLRVLALASQILLLIAEGRAQLLRTWGGAKLLKRDKGPAKETSKAPSKSSNAAALAEAFVARTEELVQPVTSEVEQTAMCQRFTEVMNVDSEARVNSDDEDAEGSDDDDDETSTRKRPSLSAPGTPSGRKRKSVDKSHGGPKKKAREGPRRSLSAVSKQTDEHDSNGEWP